MAPVKRGLQRGLTDRRRTVTLFSDATIVTETPPLRASWSKVGEPAEVAISGNRRKAAVYAALNIATGTRQVDLASRWDGDSFRDHLRQIRSRWRGWNIVLFLDRGSPHTAKRSRQLAADSGIEVRWLPTACPELNPVEDLWKWLKGTVLPNHQADDFAHTLATATDAITDLTNHETRQLTGLLSGNFWIRT